MPGLPEIRVLPSWAGGEVSSGQRTGVSIPHTGYLESRGGHIHYLGVNVWVSPCSQTQ